MKTDDMVNNYVVHTSEELGLPSAFPKLEISKAIKENLDAKHITIRKLADMIGMKHPQIVRVTSGDNNYNIDTLIKILDALELELVICSKKKS